MPFRFRRSIRIAPGLRLGLGKRGVLRVGQPAPHRHLLHNVDVYKLPATLPARRLGEVAGQRGDRPGRPVVVRMAVKGRIVGGIIFTVVIWVASLLGSAMTVGPADAAMRAWIRAREMGPRAGMTRRSVPVRHWRNYGNDPLPTSAEALDDRSARSPRGSCASVRSLRQGADDQRGALRAARHADPRHPREDAPRRLRRPGRQGGAPHRLRGRQQPAGATHRAAGGLTDRLRGSGKSRAAAKGSTRRPELNWVMTHLEEGSRCVEIALAQFTKSIVTTAS